MTTLPNATIDVLVNNPDVKSFIYQQIVDFDCFVTPQTVIHVLARDPNKLAIQYETEGKDFAPKDLKKLFRLAIMLTEGETTMEAEGVSENIYTAIKMAKDNLMQKLLAIQDSVVSHQDRLVEINHYLQYRALH